MHKNEIVPRLILYYYCRYYRQIALGLSFSLHTYTHADLRPLYACLPRRGRRRLTSNRRPSLAECYYCYSFLSHAAVIIIIVIDKIVIADTSQVPPLRSRKGYEFFTIFNVCNYYNVYTASYRSIICVDLLLLTRSNSKVNL